MLETTTDDEDFFAPVPSSNLASLFGSNKNQGNISSSNTTLTYTAPKQPSNKSDEAKNVHDAKYQSSVLIFKEVHAFKLVEKNYLNQGKCGFALIGNDAVHIYQLLLYKQKKDIISTTKLSSQFKFFTQKDNYSSFCDDQKLTWTIHFSSESDLNEFLKMLTSRGVKIIKNETSEPKNTPKINETLNKAVERVVNEELPKETDSDQVDIFGNNVKANILSRMAKMGQKLLPNTVNISDGTDSETEKDKVFHTKNRKIKRETLSEVKTPQQKISNAIATTTSMGQPSASQSYAFVNGQYVPIVQPPFIPFNSDMNSIRNTMSIENVTSPVMYTQTALSYPPQDQLQMHFTENRTHNSEVRMNLLRLTSKMEEVLQTVKNIEINPTTSLENNIQEKNMKEENETLKLSIKDLEKEIERNKQSELQRIAEMLENITFLKNENEEIKQMLEKHSNKEQDYLNKISELEEKLKQETELLTTHEAMKTDDIGDKMMDDRIEKIQEKIKKLMNSFYHDVNSNFEDDNLISGAEIKKILAQKIVDNTYIIIAAINSELNLAIEND